MTTIKPMLVVLIFFQGGIIVMFLLLMGGEIIVLRNYITFQMENLKSCPIHIQLTLLGYFYGSITKLLGFKPHRHEGKILGLAAFGNPHNAYDDISKMISYDYKNNCFKGNYEKGLYIAKFKNPNLKFLLKRYSREDIAAATQKRIEEVIIQFLKKNIKENKISFSGRSFCKCKNKPENFKFKKY